MPDLSQRLSLGALLRRPETGSVLGLALVFVFFWIFGGSNFASPNGAASWLNVAASLGIMAIPIGLLMIAGELDFSIGSMVPAGSMTCAIISGHFGLPIGVGVLAALALGALVGLINGPFGGAHRRAILHRNLGHVVCRGWPAVRGGCDCHGHHQREDPSGGRGQVPAGPFHRRGVPSHHHFGGSPPPPFGPLFCIIQNTAIGFWPRAATKFRPAMRASQPTV